MATCAPTVVAAARTRLADQVRAARADGLRLVVRGGDSKAFLACGEASHDVASTSELSGIVAFEPSELVVTVAAGTRLAELEAALDEAGQMLGFEPSRRDAASTIGGVVASGFSGPRRPFAGSVRDFVLGVEVINGRGEALRFGGQVMKNVAGYDVSRLFAGSFGALGIVTEVSLRVVPRPVREASFAWELDRDAAAARMVALQARAWPLSGLAWADGTLHARMSGSEAAIRDARVALAPEATTDGDIWSALRDTRLPSGGETGAALWRLSLPPAAPDPCAPELVDWGGALRWARQPAGQATLVDDCREAGGHAMRYTDADGRGMLGRPDEAQVGLMKRVRAAFDPDGVFYAGRYQAWLED